MQNALPENLKPLEREIGTYYRELPRLLADGNEGRYALIRDDELLSVWDTLADASQAGHERFGLDRFMAQKIRASDLKALAPYFATDCNRTSP
jgi:hypothetical protein